VVRRVSAIPLDDQSFPPIFRAYFLVCVFYSLEYLIFPRDLVRIYERATKAVSDEDRFEMFEFYITKSAGGFGITSTRPIYEKAIEVLLDKEAKEICLQFDDMERRVGEIDRSRAIYAHGSQFADPRTSPAYWDVWHNEDTFKVLSFFKCSSDGQQMLRIKLSVQAQYNTDVRYVAASAQAGKAQIDTNGAIDEGDPIAVLEWNATLSGFVESSTGLVGGGVPPVREAEEPKEGDDTLMDNPDAIELGSDDEDDTMKEG
jgi:pre-mRNA-splicing factor SYF1